MLGNSRNENLRWGQTWVIGSSNQNWGPIRLPMTLPIPVFLPGCELLVSMDLWVPGALDSGYLQVSVPSDPRLVGMRLYFQQLFIQIDTRYSRVVGYSFTTDAAEVVIGR